MSLPTYVRLRVLLVLLVVIVAFVALPIPAGAIQEAAPIRAVQSVLPFDVLDPGFEYGLAYWKVSQPLQAGVSAVGAEGAVEPFSGSKMGRLGVPAASASTAQVDRAYGLTQKFVPKTGRLRVAFRVVSWESRGFDHLVIDLKQGDSGSRSSTSLGTLDTPVTIRVGGVDKTFTTLPIKIDVKGAANSLTDSGWLPVVISGIPVGNGRAVALSYTLTTDDASQPTWVYVDEFNHAPAIEPHAYVVSEDSVLSVGSPGVLSDGVDQDTDPMRAIVTSGPSHGTLNLSDDGSFTYAPAQNFSGADSFSFRASDGTLESAEAVVSLSIAPVIDMPIALSQSVRTDGGAPRPITLAATDADGDAALTYRVVCSPANGTLSGSPPDLIYTPSTSYDGPDSFTFVAWDGTIDSNEAVVAINAVNYQAMESEGTITTNEDTPFEVWFRPYDYSGNSVTYAVTGLPSHGKLLILAPTQYLYVPDANFSGVDQIVFALGSGGSSSPKVLQIIVRAVNDAPRAFALSLTTDEDTPKSITLNGADAEGSDLTYAVIGEPLHGTLSGTAPNLTYTPDADYNGTDSFSFKVNDGVLDSVAGLVSIDVSPVGDAPRADSPQIASVYRNSSAAITLLAEDPDGDALTYSLVSDGAHGAVVAKPADNPVWVYEPADGYVGDDSFTFQASDGQHSVTAVVSITVLPGGSQAKIDVLTETPLEGYYVDMLGDASSSPDGGGITAWTWDVLGPARESGDRQVEHSVDPNVYFIPQDEGDYEVSLWVRDAEGSEDTTHTTIRVGNTAPGVSALNIEALAGPGQKAHLFGRFIDCGWLDQHAARWSLTGASGSQRDDRTAYVSSGIATAEVPVSLGAGASLTGELAVSDGDAESAVDFTITGVADDPLRDDGTGSANNDFSSASSIAALSAGSAHLSYVQTAGDVDIFELKMPDGTGLRYNTQLLVTLKDLPADFDVAVLEEPPGDGSTAPMRTAPMRTAPMRTAPMRTAPMRTAPMRTAPMRTAPMRTAPMRTAPMRTAGTEAAPMRTAPMRTAPMRTAPMRTAADITAFPLSDMSFTFGDGSSSFGAGDVAFSELGLDAIIPNEFMVVGYSAGRALTDEVVLSQVQYDGSRVFVAVVGANGAFSDRPYTLQVEASLPYSLAEATGEQTEHPPIVAEDPLSEPTPLLEPPTVRTLFVVAPARLGALYDDYVALEIDLKAFAARPDIRGEILALPSSMYDEWDRDPYSVEKANAVADSVRAAVRDATTPDTRYVVLVGGDRIIPQRRIKDRTIISNEKYYTDSSFVQADSPLAASLFGGYDLTDDFYVDAQPTMWQGAEVYVPDMAIGRLVETPNEIRSVLAAYPAVGARLEPQKALVTGYDFFIDGGQAVSGALESVGLTSSTLLTDGWTAATLRAALLDSTVEDVCNVNAHFAHYAALSSHGFDTLDYSDMMLSGDVASAPAVLAGRVVMSMGCHSGLSVGDRDVIDVDASYGIDPALDFPQAMARQGATYIGPTGFGIGDDAGIAGTERLMGVFAEQLGSASPMAVGDALVAAKQRYLTSLAQMTTYDVKSSADWTLYGLPMYPVAVPDPKATGWSLDQGSGQWSFAGLPDPLPVDPVTDKLVEVTVVDGEASIEATRALRPVSSSYGTYYQAGTELDTLNIEGRPVQPSFSIPLDPTAGAIHGMLVTGASWTDMPDGFNPVIGTYTTGWLTGVFENQSAIDGFWPAELAVLSDMDSSRAGESLVVVPGQFKRTSPDSADVVGIQRLYSDLHLEVLRSTSADVDPPTITSVNLYTPGGQTLTAAINMGGSLEPVDRIVLLAMYEGVMVGTSVQPASPGAATHVVPVNLTGLPAGATPASVTVIAQVADAAGNIAVNTGKGAALRTVSVNAGDDLTFTPGSAVTIATRIDNFASLGKPVLYEWDFGDGNKVNGEVPANSVLGPQGEAYLTMSHVYDVLAPVTATVRITEAFGGTAQDSVYLAPIPPAIMQGYVSRLGSDLTGTGSELAPWETIQHALDMVSSYGTVNVAAGMYPEHIVIRNPGVTVMTLAVGAVQVNGLAQDGPGRPITIEPGVTGVTLRGLQIMNGFATHGGGVYVGAGSQATLEQCMLFANRALGATGGGGAIYGLNANVTLSGCTLQSNQTTSSPGGAICAVNNGSAAAWVLENCTIQANNAAVGAGIYASGTDVTLTGCTLRGNQAMTSGGAIECVDSDLQVTGGLIGPNQANQAGGGIAAKGVCTVDVTGCQISTNVVPATGSGGGVYLDKAGRASAPVVTINDSTIVSNRAGMGGGIDAVDGTHLTLYGGVLSGNVASMSQDPASPEGRGGGVHVTGPLSQAHITGTTMAWNSANAYGGAICIDGLFDPVAPGGPGEPSLYVEGAAISDNTAGAGGALYADGGAGGWVNTSEVTRNHAWYGGGVYIDAQTRIALAELTVSENDAQWGGGLVWYGTAPQLQECVVQGNTAEYGGGGLFISECSSGSVGHCTVSLNRSWTGGGVYMDGASSTQLIGNSITENTASEQGGGVFVQLHAGPITQNTITNNFAAQGGGVFADGGAFYLARNTVASNTVTGDGGGLYLQSVQAASRVENNVIHRNTASAGTGGGIYAVNATPLIVNNTIADNSADTSQTFGIHIMPSVAVPVLFNNAVDNPGGADIVGATYSSCFVGDGVDAGVGTPNYTGDPGFANRTQYNLLSGSICADHGISALGALVAPTTDFLGVTRPQNGLWDIGAFEAGPS